MQSFECRTLDERSAEQEVSWFMVADLERACDLARAHLLSDPRRISLELHLDGRCIFTVTRADLLAPGPPAPSRSWFSAARRRRPTSH
ncbi:hypothetical protein [Phenylobacterium sp.]|uniref:hypothetical protein n=1 Tax=Phenylobacterium sp. TaxID=1871053 RepID=UPI002F92D718